MLGSITSIALELAKHILVKLVDGQSVESLVEEFDNDTRFINGIVEFLIDMRWVEYNHTRSLYQMTFILQLLSFELGYVVIDVGK